MNTKTALISRQCRLREWAAMIQDCQNRPAGMGVAEWCANHSITVANYYYRMTEVKKACLNAVPAQVIEQAVVPVPTELMKTGGAVVDEEPETGNSDSLELISNGITIQVNTGTSMRLLSKVLEVTAHVK
ncbi:MAG: IS66 family insertion sequence element accessory protein TnpB [Lachnospiraceae bacterium]|nr:IS66 family insertion sequence element accessory protein TnpB [Lachnospiraceae bacterium]